LPIPNPAATATAANITIYIPDINCFQSGKPMMKDFMKPNTKSSTPPIAIVHKYWV